MNEEVGNCEPGKHVIKFFQRVVKNDETALTELPIQDYTTLNDFGANF